MEEEEFFDLFRKIAREEFKWEVNIPIKINKRLKKVVGAYVFYKGCKNGRTITKPVPFYFEFNPILINKKYDMEIIINVIRHELVHWYTDTTTGKENKHNELWIKNCRKFGVWDNTDFKRYEKKKKVIR